GRVAAGYRGDQRICARNTRLSTPPVTSSGGSPTASRARGCRRSAGSSPRRRAGTWSTSCVPSPRATRRGRWARPPSQTARGSSRRTDSSPRRPTRSSSSTARGTSAPSRAEAVRPPSRTRCSPRSRSSTRSRPRRQRRRSTCTDASMEGRAPDQPGPPDRRGLGLPLLGPPGRAPGEGPRRGARGGGHRRARVDRRGRGARDPARDQRYGPHPRRDARLHACDDHGLPRRLPQDSRVGSGGRRGTIYGTGCVAGRGDHRDREGQVRRADVPRGVVRLMLAAVLGAAVPAAAATLFITNTKSESVSVIDTDTLEVVGTIPLGRGKPNRIVFHPDGRTAWVVYDKGRDLGVIDAEAR